MAEASPRLGLPFLLPAQAQKELFHNEALLIIDSMLHAAVEGTAAVTPPASPAEGQSWIVAPGGTGGWTGHDHALATWTSGGWRFAAPVPGMTVWNKATSHWLHWNGASWSAGEIIASKIVVGGNQVVGARQPAVPSPSGGTTIDAEARSALQAVIVALRTHGLIE